jgi:hypothetical protein
MGRVRAGAGSFVFLVIAPGVVAVLIPWLLTGWEAESWWAPLRVLGALMIGAGLVVLLEAFARFALHGIGTPAPVAPTERLHECLTDDQRSDGEVHGGRRRVSL